MKYKVWACKHINMAMYEFQKTKLITRVFDGAVVHDSEPGEILRKIEVECFDCGFTAIYADGFKGLPQWVSRRINSE